MTERSSRRSRLASLACLLFAVGALTATGLAVSASTGCSLAEKVSGDQCTSAADCTAIGLIGASCKNNVCTGASNVSAADWSCLGHVASLEDVAPTPVTLTMPFLNIVNNQPVPGVVSHACAKLDLDCASPLSADYTSNGEGLVSIPVTAGFDGYLKTTWSPAPTTLVFINPPQVTSVPLPATDLISEFDFETITAETTDGGKVDKTFGEIFAGAGDCNNNVAQGVSVSIDNTGPTTKIAYVIGGLPQESATETDASGEFVIINVPSGSFTITATLVATGQRIGVAAGFARPNEYSYMTVVPSP